LAEGVWLIAIKQIWAQVQALKQQAAGRRVQLQVEKQQAPWDKKIKDGLGTRPASLRNSCQMKPETPVSS
jgi:hypothetical protein